MDHLDMRTDLSALPGVSDVSANSRQACVVVSFVDWSKPIVERDPLDLSVTALHRRQSSPCFASR